MLHAYEPRPLSLWKFCKPHKRRNDSELGGGYKCCGVKRRKNLLDKMADFRDIWGGLSPQALLVPPPMGMEWSRRPAVSVSVPPTNNPLSQVAHKIFLHHVDPSSADVDPEHMYIGVRLFVHTLV